MRLADILRGGFRGDPKARGSHLGPARDQSYVATAIEALQPELAVIENVRRLLSANCNRQPDPRRGAPHDDRNPEPATAVRNQEHAQAFLARSHTAMNYESR